MARVPDRLVIEFLYLAQESVGQRRGSTRRLKRLERRKAVERQTLELRHRVNLGDLTIAYHACDLDVFVDQPFYTKDKLVVERRLRILRQTADANVDLINGIKILRTMHRQDRDHSRREAAIRNDVH